MSPIEAMIAIQRLERRKIDTIALVPADAIESGCHIVRTASNGNGEALFHYVDRIEYINHLKGKYKLFKKRGSDVFRSGLRKS